MSFTACYNSHNFHNLNSAEKFDQYKVFTLKAIAQMDYGKQITIKFTSENRLNSIKKL